LENTLYDGAKFFLLETFFLPKLLFFNRKYIFVRAGESVDVTIAATPSARGIFSLRNG
jgi:hypothetical protein